VIQTFNGINALRQHLKDDVRVHGIITEGGVATNVIPDRAIAEFLVRARDSVGLEEAVEKVIACARGAATTTGTTLEIEQSNYPYEAMCSNSILADVFAESLPQAGYNFQSAQAGEVGSIDMGNVSLVTPSIYPLLALTDQWVPRHTPEFTAICNTERAYEVMLAAGRAMAITGLKVIDSPVLQEKIKEEFSNLKQN